MKFNPGDNAALYQARYDSQGKLWGVATIAPWISGKQITLYRLNDDQSWIVVPENSHSGGYCIGFDLVFEEFDFPDQLPLEILELEDPEICFPEMQ